MRGYNKTIIAGNLTTDPEIRYLADQTAVVGVSVAINSVRGSGVEKKERVDYVDVTFYGKLAEIVAKHLKKGSPILVEGPLRQQRWQDKDTGQNRSKLSLVASEMRFLGFNPQQQNSAVPHNVGQVFPDAAPVDEGDIPF
jgi:single-strand DNA-binding protein